MSKRSRTTLTIQIKLPLPPGAVQKQVEPWLLEALRKAVKEYPEPVAFGNLQVAEVQVKIVARDTVYL